MGVLHGCSFAILFAEVHSTSGLDASIALSVMQVLRDIAATGRTVIGKLDGPFLGTSADVSATIHQPRSDIWQLADNVTLLAKGGVVAVSFHVTTFTYQILANVAVLWKTLRGGSVLHLNRSSNAIRILQPGRPPT